MKRTVAIVPMRATSERIPRKNLRGCAGRPLYHYVISTLQQVKEIQEIVIDTDCDEITADAKRHFPAVRVLRRHPDLCGPLVAMNDVLLGALPAIEADWILQTHSTNPLLEAASVRRAVLEMQSSQQYDSLFSVTPRQARFWYGQNRPVNHDPSVLLRTQDLPPLYEENSCLYLFPPELLRKRGNRIGERPLLFEVSRREAIDIDEWLDFEIAEGLLERNSRPG
jgi:CMP-N-acetylneuraminic acid synthetase